MSLSSVASSARITSLYRRNVSNFLSYSDAILRQDVSSDDTNHRDLTSWIGDTARSLGLRSANTQLADGDEISGADSASKKKKNKSSTSNNAEDIIRTLPSTNTSDFTCMACGSFLFPPEVPTTATACKDHDGKTDNNVYITQSVSSQSSSSLSLPSNMYIRPLKRGRTRRRRASRAKAKELHNRALSIQRRGGGGTSSGISNQIRKENMAKERMQRVSSSYRLGDGRAKNCLVMECTFCGTKKKRKGMEVKGQKIGSKVDGREGICAEGRKRAGLDNRKERNGVKQHQQRTEKKANVVSQIRDNTDYISLSSIGGLGFKKEQAVAMIQKGKRKQDDNVSPLLGGKKKKKRKKTETEKGGKLMDFLSSLND